MDALTVESAACLGHHPTMFADRDHITAAPGKAICNTCPIINACERDHHNEQHGIWFATTPAERGYRTVRAQTRRGEHRRDSAAHTAITHMRRHPDQAFTIAQLADHAHATRPTMRDAVRRLYYNNQVTRQRGEITNSMMYQAVTE